MYGYERRLVIFFSFTGKRLLCLIFRFVHDLDIKRINIQSDFTSDFREACTVYQPRESKQILEFIDMEHTPKNLLIRAVKRGEKADKKQEKIENSYKTLCDELNAHGTLEKILNM